MARKPQTDHRPSSSKGVRTGFQKMQMSHQRTRKEIQRIHLEQAKRTETGKPRHLEGSHRR